jgi:hypothetical protein
VKYLLGGLALLGLCATQAAAETWHPYSRSAAPAPTKSRLPK